MENRTSGGIGFTGLLQVALIVLKLCGVIDWQWKFVFIPMIISIILAVAVLIVVMFINWRA